MSEKDDYIKALEEELCASIEREEKLLEEDLGLGAFLMRKIKKNKLYKSTVAEPDSKIGKIVRAPRSFYRMIKNPEVRRNLLQKKTINNTLLEKTAEPHFLEPWLVSLARRKEIAEEALSSGKKLALYYVEKPDSSTFRYRCYNTFQATTKSSKWQAVYFFKQELETMEELLPKSSILIMGRQSGQEKNVGKLVKLAHRYGIQAGMDIDDLVFDMKYLDLMLDTIGEKTNQSYWVAYFGGVQAMAKQMDFFITTNKFLSDKIEKSYNKPCREIRNSLDEEQVSASEVYSKRKRRDDGRFVIGYFSGSPTHKKDLDQALPEVLKFLDSHKNAVLEIVGFMKFSKNTQKYVDSGAIRFVPFVDYRKLQRLMAEVDVNIAPLIVNDFTNCKSELKFFEAAMVETTTIASPTYTFKKAIKNGENGYLAKPGEWYDKLEYLCTHPKKNRDIALNAKKYALKHYYGKEFLGEVETVYEYFAK